MSWNAAVEKFKQAFPKYQERTSQTALAEALEASFASGEPLLAQAPPGTGKSYVAIIEAMDRAIESSMPSVCSTATKALQDQYINDCADIKTHVFPEFRFTVLKGRGNYLCKSKMDKADEVLLGLPKSIDDINQIAEDDAVLGDVERLGFELQGRQRAALTTTSDECPGKSTCKFGSVCFAERAKAKAEQSHVIIVNHAMLAVDATLRVRTQGFVSLLPSFPTLIVDEAHELRGYVENAQSTQLTRRGLSNLATEVANYSDNLELVPASQIVVDPLFRALDDIIGKPDRSGRSDDVDLVPAIVAELSPKLMALYEFMSELDAKVAMVRVSTDDEQDRKNRLRKKVQTMTEKLVKVMVDPFSETVRWVGRDRVEVDGMVPPAVLCTAPLDVAAFLNEALWQETHPIMMSATLALGEDFTYMAKEHGLDLAGRYRTFDCPSPFDFKTQAATYIPNGLPDLRNAPAAHMAAFNMHNLELIRAAGGRSLLLFTSWANLADSYAELAPRLRDELGVAVYKQGDLGSVPALRDAFRDDETSVLFATKSFGTGVNIEGNSLLYLGIHRSPYHYPDVLWKARCEAVDAALTDREKSYKGSFAKMMLPDMTMTLIQWYGRLIRSVSDRGVVGLFDTSLATVGGKKYGATVRRQIPQAPIVDNLRDAVARLADLRAEIESMETTS